VSDRINVEERIHASAGEHSSRDDEDEHVDSSTEEHLQQLGLLASSGQRRGPGRRRGTKAEKCQEYRYFRSRATEANERYSKLTKAAARKAKAEGKTVDISSLPAFDLLGFWSVLQRGESSGRAPPTCRCTILCRIARRVLAAPAGAAMSESTFSLAGNTVSDTRTKLLPAFVNDLVTGQSFMRRCSATIPPRMSSNSSAVAFPGPDWIPYVEGKTGINVVEFMVNDRMVAASPAP